MELDALTKMLEIIFCAVIVLFVVSAVILFRVAWYVIPVVAVVLVIKWIL